MRNWASLPPSLLYSQAVSSRPFTQRAGRCPSRRSNGLRLGQADDGHVAATDGEVSVGTANRYENGVGFEQGFHDVPAALVALDRHHGRQMHWDHPGVGNQVVLEASAFEQCFGEEQHGRFSRDGFELVMSVAFTAGVLYHVPNEPMPFETAATGVLRWSRRITAQER